MAAFHSSDTTNSGSSPPTTSTRCVQGVGTASLQKHPSSSIWFADLYLPLAAQPYHIKSQRTSLKKLNATLQFDGASDDVKTTSFISNSPCACHLPFESHNISTMNRIWASNPLFLGLSPSLFRHVSILGDLYEIILVIRI